MANTPQPAADIAPEAHDTTGQTNTTHPNPVIDQRPTAAPIAIDQRSLDDLLKAHPAPASPDWVQALEPNRLEDAVAGPHAQIDPNSYVHMTRPGGGEEFLAPLSNVPYYESKGFKAGNTEVITDVVAYWHDKGLTDVQRERNANMAAKIKENTEREQQERAARDRALH